MVSVILLTCRKVNTFIGGGKQNENFSVTVINIVRKLEVTSYTSYFSNVYRE